MAAERYHTIDDLRDGAKRRLPKFVFDYLDGGAGNEANLRRNREGFAALTLKPEYLRDVSKRSQSATLFGHTYDVPIGISPVGLSNLIWPGTDIILATLARERNIPYLLSGVATTSLERIAEVAPDNAWLQVHSTDPIDVGLDLVRRAKDAGINAIVVTVDFPVASKRLRDLRNNFVMPFRMTPKTVWDIAAHPAWALATFGAERLRFENFMPYLGEDRKSDPIGAATAMKVSGDYSEQVIRQFRDAWDGPMIIKGLLTPGSAEAAKRIGADGIIVSNHGGRQLDSAPATIEALPGIVAAVSSSMTVMLDSGIRSGADIVKAYSLGADFVFSGRCFVYATGALGAAGGNRALDILTDEVDRTLAQIGRTAMAELGSDCLWPAD